MTDPEVIIVPIVFGLPSLVWMVRMWLKHRERMIELKGARNPMVEARLTRIEEAVETIAIEIERMGEGQRFVTKLLTERAPPELAEGSTNPNPGRASTPR
jgi:hypothetical protein